MPNTPAAITRAVERAQGARTEACRDRRWNSLVVMQQYLSARAAPIVLNKWGMSRQSPKRYVRRAIMRLNDQAHPLSFMKIVRQVGFEYAVGEGGL